MSEHVKVSKLKRMSAMIRDRLKALAIYGALLVFSLYPLLPDKPPVEELQDFVQGMLEPFVKLGRFINLNRKADMRLIKRSATRTAGRYSNTPQRSAMWKSRSTRRTTPRDTASRSVPTPSSQKSTV